MCLGIGTSCVFGGGEYEGREVDREELEVSENRDRRLLLLQHQAKTISRSKPLMLTPMMMPPACSRRIPVSVVVMAAASALRAIEIPVAPVLSGSGPVIVTHAAVANVVLVAERRSGTTWVSTLSSSCIGQPSKAGLSCKVTRAMEFSELIQT